MLAEDNPVYLVPNTSDNCFIDSDYAKDEGLQSAALFRLEMKDQLMVVAFGFSTPRTFSSSKLQLYSLASRLALLLHRSIGPSSP